MRSMARGSLCEDDEVGAGGAFDGLLGLVVEVVVLQAAVGRSHRGGVGHRSRGQRNPPV